MAGGAAVSFFESGGGIKMWLVVHLVLTKWIGRIVNTGCGI
jgi:hypothetical protein